MRTEKHKFHLKKNQKSQNCNNMNLRNIHQIHSFEITIKKTVTLYSFLFLRFPSRLLHNKISFF